MREPDYSILSKLRRSTKPRKSLVGQTFNRWTVYGFVGYSNYDKSFWLCRCACGNWRFIRVNALQSKKSQSCGCYRVVVNHLHATHNMTNTTVFSRWTDMHTRCYNTHCKPYHNYGGRGIIVEERWHTFENFYADMGDPPTLKHTLERKNNNGNYGPDNCIWDATKNQARNTRRNVFLTMNGETHCAAEWAEILNVPCGRIYRRHRKGLPDIDCLS
jgi:hypothetical protein